MSPNRMEVLKFVTDSMYVTSSVFGGFNKLLFFVDLNFFRRIPKRLDRYMFVTTALRRLYLGIFLDFSELQMSHEVNWKKLTSVTEYMSIAIRYLLWVLVGST